MMPDNIPLVTLPFRLDLRVPPEPEPEATEPLSELDVCLADRPRRSSLLPAVLFVLALLFLVSTTSLPDDPGGRVAA
jgi:hypothetical protein